MNKNLVVKDNALINASYNLELVEHRLIMLSVIEARRTKQEISSNEFLTIYAERYIVEFGVHRNVAYQALKDACRHLFERRFTYQKLTQKGNKEVVTSRWVQSISYVENEAIVRLKFSDDVAPLIHNLEKNFTSYELEQVAGLNSKYAVRLYEVVIAWRSVGKTPMIAIDELRERLGVLDSEYTELKNLKARVIDFAIQQINQKTNITLTYEQHKNGRKIIGFTFTIKQMKQKATNKKPKKQTPKPTDIFNGFTDLERQTIQQRIDEHIQRLESKGETIDDWYKENITNKAINEKWGLDALAKQQQKEQERQAKKAKKQAEQQAKAKAEQEKAEQAEQRRNAMIAKFESLSPDEQEQILDQVAKNIDGMFAKIFKTARASGIAHKDIMFFGWFFKVMDM